VAVQPRLGEAQVTRDGVDSSVSCRTMRNPGGGPTTSGEDDSTVALANPAPVDMMKQPQ
jgi:hypothetical protein